MARKKRDNITFNLSFLDIMSCGFGAVVLVFLIIDHSVQQQTKVLNAETLSEITLLEKDIRDGEEGLVQLKNALAEVDLEIVQAEGLATRVTEELDQYEALIASLKEEGFTDSADIDELKAEIRRLEEEVTKLKEASDSEAGKSARDFTGDGNRQYLTGLNLGGERILILLDMSSSMLADRIVNIVLLRNMAADLQRQAPKWVQARETVNWLTAQLPINSKFQVIAFNTEAGALLPETEGQWLEVADSPKLEAISDAMIKRLPTGGTSLHNAFKAAANMNPRPDNIFLITDGLPTQGASKSNKNKISSSDRIRLYRQAVKLLPAKVPVNIILGPMEGDPMAASEFWQLAQVSGGSFMSPSSDWP